MKKGLSVLLAVIMLIAEISTGVAAIAATVNRVYTPGDSNMDGQVALIDLMLYQRYLNGWDVSVHSLAVDVNGDSKMNILDLAILQRYLNGWDVTLKSAGLTDETYTSVGRDYVYTTANMLANTRMSVGTADVITDKTLIFTADVTSFDGLRLGHGYCDYTGNYIEIDQTSIKQYFYASSAVLHKEVSHGLDISSNLRVTITVNARRVAAVTLESNGQTYTFSTSTNWYGSNGEIFAESLGSVLPNAQLIWTCDGYQDTIHFYGDSYLSQSSDRWLYFAVQEGRTNALFDGYGGRGSAAAYSSLVNNLQRSRPEKVVWLMGMNDGTDVNIDTPSSRWAVYRDELIALSKKYDFEIIFATIPTVPKINHEAKNKWIRESGYRYIDVAAAVGADGTGAWTEGMLHTDNVHPTAHGARAIYQQILQDLPEFQ